MVSLVVVLSEAEQYVDRIVCSLNQVMPEICTRHELDYEILFVDNGSRDNTFASLEKLTANLKDIRAISLVSSSSPEPALLAGMEHALGDWVVLMDPTQDSPVALSAMIQTLASGSDLVLATRHNTGRSLAYRVLSWIFVALFMRLVDVNLRTQAGHYRGMSRKVVSYVTSHDQALIAHRALPSLGGFRTVVVDGSGEPVMPLASRRDLIEGFYQAMGLLTSTSTTPLRMATLSCSVAATLSLVYSLYVAVVYLLGTNVAQGWTTMSLQISGMFFLLAVSVALLSEHVVQISSSSTRKPPYHIVRECRSLDITREKRLNVV